MLGTEDGWPWLLAITAIPAILQLATLPFCPESPKYLLLDKDDEMAAQTGNFRVVRNILTSHPPDSPGLAERNH